MSVHAGPNVNITGLVFAIDGANTKSFDNRENLCPVNSVPDAVYDIEDISVLAPDGNPSRKFFEGTTNLAFALTRTFSSTVSVEVGKQYNYSCYFKEGGLNRFIRLQWDGSTPAFGNSIVASFNYNTKTFSTFGPVASTGYEELSNGWYRVWFVTQAAIASASTIVPRLYMTLSHSTTQNYDNSTNSFYYYYGPQITTGAELKPYVRTTGSAITLTNTVTNLIDNSSGTLVNSPAYSVLNQGSLIFDGVNDYIEFGGAARYFTSYITQEITIETWIYVPSSATWSNGFYGNIVTRGFFGGSHGLWRTTTNNEVSAWFRQTGVFVGGGQVESRGNITRDTWNQLVAVWKAPGSALYINGNLVNQNSTPLESASAVPTDDLWYIGRNTAAGGNNGNYFTGNQTATKIYNRALSAQEIAQNYSALRSRFDL